MTKFAVHCLGRMGFGHKITEDSNDIADFQALGGNDNARLSAYLAQQLNWQSIDDSVLDDMVAAEHFPTIDKPLTQMWQDHHVNRDADGFDRDSPIEDMDKLVLARAIHSKRQLLEILADFWHNHFNVFGRGFYEQSVMTSWDRDVIRPPVAGHPRPADNPHGHLFGNFRQMLELSSKHIAMSYYLDNYINREGSPNENYAREIIELHTLGAENYISLGNPDDIPRSNLSFPWGTESITDKYVDDDIYAAMRMLTGWTVKNGRADVSSGDDTGEFYFHEPWHDQFAKTILGYDWGNFSSNPEDILRFFDILAYHPGTAKHIAGKLCRRFISDTPSQATIDSVADTFYQNRYAANQLELVYQTLFLSAEFKNPSSYKEKLKRPFELMASSVRAVGSDFMPRRFDSDTGTYINYLGRAGQRSFHLSTPDGYPDTREYWVGGTSLIYVMRFADWMVDHYSTNPDRWIFSVLETTLNASSADLPSHTPNNLTSFWMKRLLGYEPSSGWQGTTLHKNLRNFMRQHPKDPTQWPANTPFTDIASGGPHYIFERLRGLVKLILSSPKFMNR
ncbi:MAG: DUF1800 domain-containing protein [Proteobacteria bacterium]|nr:DUF1800 domain-containing protein [Pseudomonadota bacterium]